MAVFSKRTLLCVARHTSAYLSDLICSQRVSEREKQRRRERGGVYGVWGNMLIKLPPLFVLGSTVLFGVWKGDFI